MASPNGFVVYKYSFRKMKMAQMRPRKENEVEYTEDKSEALVHPTYESARWDIAGRDHLEYVHIGEFFHIERK